MKKKPGSRTRRKRRSLKGDRYLWILLCLIILLVINLLLLDTLLGIRLGRHFLPKPLYTPLVSLFVPRSSQKPAPPVDITLPEEAVKAPEQDTITTKKKGKDVPKPRLALVIDDLGYSPELAEELFEVDFPLTVSVLPNLPYSGFIARQAIQKGKEVILHLPMEPYDYPNAHVEKGTLLTSMQDNEIRQLIQKALKDLDGAVGANNHMGSKMVENEEKMRIVLEQMKEKGLFFLDSRTSPRSIVYELAQRMGVKTAERDVFLDGQNNIEYIYKQLEQVADLAKNNGYGIAIGHLQPKTIEALRMYLPQIEKSGIQLVKLSEVIE